MATRVWDGMLMTSKSLIQSSGMPRSYHSRWGKDKLFRLGKGRSDKQEVATVHLGLGDVCVMAGRMQKFYQHRIPVEKVVEGMRIKLIWK